MNALTQIEKIYEDWDGTEPDACVCLRKINLILRRSEIDILNNYYYDKERILGNNK